jgi:tubulin polyglutamylase TTLL6/13
MGSEVLETQVPEMLASSWPPMQSSLNKQGVINLEALGALLGGQVGEWSASVEQPTSAPSTAQPLDGASSSSEETEADQLAGVSAPQEEPLEAYLGCLQVNEGEVEAFQPIVDLDSSREPLQESQTEAIQHSVAPEPSTVPLEASQCCTPLGESKTEVETEVVQPAVASERSKQPLEVRREDIQADELGGVLVQPPLASEHSGESPPEAKQAPAAQADLEAEVVQNAVAAASSEEPVSQPEAARPAVVEERGPKKKVLFNASHTDYECVAAAAEARGWRVVKQEERAGPCNVHWIDDSGIGDWFRRVEPWMRVNHFPGMNNALARKTRLARNMCRMMRSFPESYRFIPPTWVLPEDVNDLTKRFDSSGETKAIYIVKPDHLCQGRGIFLTTDLERIKEVSVESRKKGEAVVVQRYIKQPMLIDGLKFDLRLYFLVTGVLGEGGTLEPRYFLFRDGLVRLCTTPYEAPTPENFGNRCLHLTNYAINKNSKDFQQGTSADDGTGSKRSLRWFLNYVEEEFGEKERRKLWQKLMGLCNKTLLTVHSTLEAEYAGAFPRDLSGGQYGCRCFEILGVDVMLDAKRKPYLIEVNHLPSFTCDSPLDEDIKRRLVDQTMDLTCGTLSAKDKKSYEQLVRDRREAAGAATATTSAAASAKQTPAESMMDLVEYKDFERAYPVPASAPKLAVQCEAILTKVREIFRPVQNARRPRATPDDSEGQPPASQRPPPLPSTAYPRPGAPSSNPAADLRPPPNVTRAPSTAEAVAMSAAPPGLRRMAQAAATVDGDAAARRTCSSAVPPGSERAPPPAKKRSRSAPGPPRCALPPIARFTSPRLVRHLTATPELAEQEGSAAPVRQAAVVRVPSRQRAFLPLKSAQILL